MNVEQTEQEAILTFTISMTRSEVETLLKGDPKAFKKLIDELRRARAAYVRTATGFGLDKPANPIHLEA